MSPSQVAEEGKKNANHKELIVMSEVEKYGRRLPSGNVMVASEHFSSSANFLLHITFTLP